MTRLIVSALLVACVAADAAAQAAAPLEPGRFEVGVGPLWIGAASFGERAATETDSTGGAVPLFSTRTSLDSVTGVELHVGVRMTHRLDAEAVGSYAGPHLVATTRNDREAGAGPFIAEEWVQQYTVGGAVVLKLREPIRHPRWVPFARAGAAYMRQLHEAQTLLVAGQLYDMGGGVKYLLGSRSRGWLKTAGVRADARAIVRAAGVNTDGRAHVSPAFAASFFVRF